MREIKTISIKCETKDYLDWHNITEFQGGLKIRNEADNDYVIEPFGGSGTTLIACEKTNRKCRIMELDPIYCDVIRRRYTQWAKENGKPITSGCLE